MDPQKQIPDINKWQINTDRLLIRFATTDDKDINFLFKLWNNPKVTTFQGFPNGLKLNFEQIEKQMSNYSGDEYGRVLVATLRSTGDIIGECKIDRPNKDNIAKTDIKLNPDYWGNHYGIEIKKAFIKYLFNNTDCHGVQGDPNKMNIASIKMQEAVGGRKIREGCHKFLEHMKDFTNDVNFILYIVYREDWENSN